MNVNHLIGVIIVWVMCIFTWAIVSLPVKAQTPKVEVETTAYLHAGTTLDVGSATVSLRLVSFTEGTVCVVGNSMHSGRIQLECDFSRSSLVHNK